MCGAVQGNYYTITHKAIDLDWTTGVREARRPHEHSSVTVWKYVTRYEIKGGIPCPDRDPISGDGIVKAQYSMFSTLLSQFYDHYGEGEGPAHGLLSPYPCFLFAFVHGR